MSNRTSDSEFAVPVSIRRASNGCFGSGRAAFVSSNSFSFHWKKCHFHSHYFLFVKFCIQNF